jgi:lipoprotein-releasing system permease protein
VLVGKLLAERLGITAGDKIEILTLGTSRPARLTVNSVFESGIHEYDATWIRLPRNKFAGVVGEDVFTPRVIELRLTDIFRSKETALQIRELLGGDFKVADWQEANRNLFAALALEQKAAGLIVGLIIFVAVLNITTTLSLLTHERRFDIGVFRACGARSRSIASIFLVEGGLIGVIGAGFGIVAGLAACSIGNRFNLVSLPADVYSINRIPFHPAAENIAVIAVAAIVLATLAAVYPAYRAGRYSAIENLRAH